MTTPTQTQAPAPTPAPAPAGYLAHARRLLSSGLVRSSGIYVASNVLNRAIPFILLPILTRYLSPEDFGRVTMFTLLVTLLLPVAGLNTDGAVARQFFEPDRGSFSRYVSSCFAILAATLAVAAVAIWLSSGVISSWSRLPIEWIYAGLLVAAGRFVSQVALSRWQMERRPWSYAVYSGLQTLIVFGVAVSLVVPYRGGWRGRMAADVIGITVTALAGVIVLWRAGWLAGRPSWPDARNALAFGAGLLPHVYGAALLTGVTDRLFITHLVGLDATGLYAVALQIAMVVTVLEHSVNQAWIPWLYARLTSNTAADHDLVRRITHWYYAGILAFALIFAWVAQRLVVLFVGPTFGGASQFVQWLALAAAFGGMYKMVVNQIFFVRRTYLLAIITFSVGTFNVVMTWVLVTRYGATGAARATAISQFALFAATAFVSHRLMRDLRSVGAT